MKVGQQYTVRLKDKSLAHAYPWEGIAVPVKVIGEYEFFYLATVLPHRNERGSMSKPYNVTFSKQQLKEQAFIYE